MPTGSPAIAAQQSLTLGRRTGSGGFPDLGRSEPDIGHRCRSGERGRPGRSSYLGNEDSHPLMMAYAWGRASRTDPVRLVPPAGN